MPAYLLGSVQAFRKLALTKHPDKQPNNPNAAAEFGAIQRAYEVLLDAAAKEAWDNLARSAFTRACLSCAANQ